MVVLLRGRPAGDARGSSAVEDLRNADIIYAIDYVTDERLALLYGDPATESLPTYYLRPWEAPCVMGYRVIAGSGDLVLLIEAVRDIKGSCLYPAAGSEAWDADP